MAVIDQDNFSNISWHSDQNAPGGNISSGGYDGQDEEGATSKAPQQQEGLDAAGNQQLEPNPGGSEILECTVTDAHTENSGTKDAYVSYLITTNTTFSSFMKPTSHVRRRFTDFVFLYKTLGRDYPACAVPSIPDKQRMEYVRGDRFGPDFTQRRAYSLQRFLARCSLHPILRRASILHQFLESPDWNAIMQSRLSRSNTANSAEAGSGGVFDNFADTFINVFTKVHKPDRRFIEVKEKSDKLDEDLSQVEKVVARVARRENDLEADLRDLAEQFQKLITLEPGVEAAVHAFAASVEDTATGLKKLKDHTDQDYLGSLRDMVAYSGALKNLLKAREQKQLDYEQLTEYLNKSTVDRDSLASGGGGGGVGSGPAGFIRSKIEDVRGVDHEQARRERLRRLEVRIDELTREAETARKESDLFDEEVVREVADFERIKRVEFKGQLGRLADAHVSYYGEVVDVWQRYVDEMEREGVSLPA
ncbi:intercellular trafficking and secretion [Cytospora paraplurivora]|uniref:Sorting nexin-4 n=1 Tax=Cytospora paraplurivora TaxID=2898453 RepID=A0AAN9UG88_9PEZI